MVVLSKGERRCDERCYNAMWAGCSCVCGGKNHGKGLEHALERREAMSETFAGNFGGRSFDEMATDEMRKDALMEVEDADAADRA